MRKFILAILLTFLIIPSVLADPLPVPDVRDIPAPGGLQSVPTLRETNPAPGGLNAVPANRDPSVPNSNGPANVMVTGSGTFLQISVPDNHGLPGSEGAEPMIRRVIDNALGLIALIGIGGFIFAALQLWVAQGKADGIGKAKTNIFNLIIGFVVVLLAWSAVTIALKYLGF